MAVQVVKRAASAAEASFGDSMPIVGTKRSVRDRLGRGAEDGYLQNGSLFNGNSKRCVIYRLRKPMSTLLCCFSGSRLIVSLIRIDILCIF